MPLSNQKELFCQYYVASMNATNAAKKAGYKKENARTQGSKLLTNADIKERVTILQKEMAERNKLKADDIINELRKLAFWDIKSFLKTGNSIKDISRLNIDTAKPIIGIKTKETKMGAVIEITTEIKLADKRAALVDLGRHIGIFDKDNVQKAIKIKVSRK